MLLKLNLKPFGEPEFLYPQILEELLQLFICLFQPTSDYFNTEEMDVNPYSNLCSFEQNRESNSFAKIKFKRRHT